MSPSRVEVVSLEQADAMDVTGTNTLVIRLLVKQVEFMGGGARFFAGAMAGSSVIVMDTAVVDGATGEVMAEPGHDRWASAFGDGFGVGDNLMLNAVAEDGARYAMTNR